jgi:hypothetical protein
MLCTIQSITGFFGWYDYRYISYSFSKYYLSSEYLLLVDKYKRYAPQRHQQQHRDHAPLPPPLSKIMPSCDEDSRGIDKKIVDG